MAIGRTLSDFLNEISMKYRGADAYRWYENDRLCCRTYKELNQDSRRIASYLTVHFGPGTHIALLGETSYAWITSYFGVMTGSCVSVPLDAKLDSENLAARINKADVTVLLLSDRFNHLSDGFRRMCPQLKAIISMNEMLTLSAAGDPDFTTEIDENALAQIMFTSGTTGVGKGVMISHRNIMYVTHGSTHLCEPGDRLLSVLPLHHCFELFYTQLSYLLQGAVICVNDALENIILNMNRFGIHILITVPMLANRFAAMITRKENELSPEQIRGLFGGCFKLIGVGGAVPGENVIKTMQRAGLDVFSGYGLTEGTGGCIVNPIDSIRYESIGLPFVEGLQVKIIDGELCLKGPTVMLGYYKDEEATKETITDGWLHTGDLGYIDEDGYIYLNGRKNNMIVTSNGENVYPEELEGYISELPGVAEVIVYNRDNRLAAGIRLTDMSFEKTVNEGIAAINGRVPTYKAIASVSFQTSPFPVTTSMKVKRKEAIAHLLQHPAVMCTNMEKKEDTMDRNTDNRLEAICDAFAAALGLDEFAPESSFFEEGGDSLAAIEAAAELSELFESISPNDIYINPTPKMLYYCFCGESSEESKLIKIPNINALIAAKNEMPRGLGRILLTGATGYLGIHILHTLLEKKYPVTCLIRSRGKFDQVCGYYFPGYDFSAVKTVIGDITEKRLGLSEAVYAETVGSIDTVIHTAADVRHSGFENELQKTNVTGTKEVIAFCVDAGAKLFHTSSFAVAGFRTDNQLTEDVLDIGQQIAQNVYIKSKYQAEEQVLLARKQGVHASIMRMGYLTWRKDGMFQINEADNGLVAELRAFKKLGMYPRELSDLSFDFSGVDESAEAFVLLAENADRDSIWHVINPNRIELAQLNLGKAVSTDMFVQNVARNNTDRDVIILSMYMQMIRNGINGNVDPSRTADALRNLGFVWRVPTSDIPI